MAIIYGTNGNDMGATALIGTSGSDTIDGMNGNDQLYANGGNDILVGGLGSDTLHGGAGSDLVSFAYSSSGVLASIKDGTATATDIAGDSDTLISIENLWGSAQRDWLLGDAAVNEIFGAKGDDYLEGMGGADKISGGNGMDMASYYLSNEGVYVNLMSGATLFGHAEGDQLFSIESLNGSGFDDQFKGTNGANELRGQGGNDLLRGEGGHDTILGGAGQDRIVGGDGADQLTGGEGVDKFIYEAYGDSDPGSYDTIFDFTQGQSDKIVLEGIDAKSHSTGNQAFSFIGTSGFWAEGQVRYFHQNGDTVIECNLVEENGAEMKIVLDGAINLSSFDFIL
ncbi:calcium-binding protein [Arenibaculum pallidiluteum]|uniref:calcium-binding protein n=1 Tax=Arenibaculum pallidiluteum TaxID=2812559 RepID=UPI001A963217|nr:calcium-binding protein [Arenibaculum pallidiluteum]